jgi:hypothetical protein
MVGCATNDRLSRQALDELSALSPQFQRLQQLDTIEVIAAFGFDSN